MTYRPYNKIDCAYDASQTDESAGSFTDVITLTFTPEVSGTHSWRVTFDGSTKAPATFSAITRLDVDGSPYSERHHENGGNWIGASGIAYVSLDKTSHTIKVQMKTSQAAQTASMQEVYLCAEICC